MQRYIKQTQKRSEVPNAKKKKIDLAYAMQTHHGTNTLVTRTHGDEANDHQNFSGGNSDAYGYRQVAGKYSALKKKKAEPL
jgi:hypothetical protein